MQLSFLIALCCAFYNCKDVSAEVEHEVKRGVFPFMAFLYYPDEIVVDSTGMRFLHGAVLIRPEWLISSAIDHSVLDNVPLGFPRRTLLARLGAISIDASFTLNEDEDEQEREIVQIVRPSIHNVEEWWFTDISLLKTLLPFTPTPGVGFTSIQPKSKYVDKNCVILVYAKKYGNQTEDKILMQLVVDILPASMDNCGTQFNDASMTCAVDTDDTRHAVYDPEFCQGNSGGPLLCEGQVLALQTYIENNCKPPHLYQLLSSWEKFISCGVQEKCSHGECPNVCTVTYKDEIVPVTVATDHSTQDAVKSPPLPSSEVANTSQSIELTSRPTEPLSADHDMSDYIANVAKTEETITESEKTKPKSPTPTEITTTTTSTTTESTITEVVTTESAKSTSTEPLPKVNLVEMKEGDKMLWQANVERQSEGKRSVSGAPRNTKWSQSMFWYLYFGVCNLVFV